MKIENDSIVHGDITYGKVWEVDGLWFSQVFAKCAERVDAGDYEYSDPRDIPSFAYVLDRHDTREDLEKHVAGLTFGRQHSPFGEDLHFIDYTDEDSEDLECYRIVEITDAEPEEIENAVCGMVNDAIRTRDYRLEEARKLREWKFRPDQLRFEIAGDWDHCSLFHLVKDIENEKWPEKIADITCNCGGWGGPDDDHFKDWYSYRDHKFPDPDSFMKWAKEDIVSFDWWRSQHSSGFSPVFKEQSFPVDADNLVFQEWEKTLDWYVKRDKMLYHIGSQYYGLGNEVDSFFGRKQDKSRIAVPWRAIDLYQKGRDGYFGSVEEAKTWVLANIDEVKVGADGQITAWKDGKQAGVYDTGGNAV